jgi:hypothetical protein
MYEYTGALGWRLGIARKAEMLEEIRSGVTKKMTALAECDEVQDSANEMIVPVRNTQGEKDPRRTPVLPPVGIGHEGKAAPETKDSMRSRVCTPPANEQAVKLHPFELVDVDDDG